jgi:hypothetical protein
MGESAQKAEERITTMKTIKLLTIIAAFGLLGFSAQAQGSVSTLTFTLTAQVQSANSGTGSTYTYKASKIKLINKDILALLATAYGTNFPAKARLMGDHGGSCYVYDADQNEIREVSDVLSRKDNDDIRVGKDVDTPTGALNNTYYAITAFNFEDPAHGTEFQILGAGACTVTYKYATGKWTESFKMTGAGDGAITNNFAIFTGTITAKGSGM